MNSTVTIDENAGMHTLRPRFRISDLWRTPLHDFPIRDEILYQWFPLAKTAKVLEIGPGSGITAFRLSRHVAHLTSVELGARNVDRLRDTYRAVPNLRFICADVSATDFPDKVPDSFDAVFGLDFFEYATDPYMCMKNLAAAVRPGGTLLLAWPNYVPSRTGGVTYIPTRAELNDLLAASGLCNWQAYALQLRPHASTLFKWFHELPLGFVRRFRQSNVKHPPKLFDDTWAFRKGQRLESCKVPIHAYWAALSTAMRFGGDCYRRIAVPGRSLDCNLLLLAQR